MRRPSGITVVGLPLIALVLLPAVTNIATGALPEKWQPFLWLAWPLAAALAVPVVVAEVRSRRRVAGPGIEAKREMTTAPDGVIWNIPPALATFTGRKAELRAIDRAVTRQPGGAAVLSGLAGAGKTQVAAAYAAVHRGAFDLGWWVVADSRLAVVTSLAQLADLLGVGGDDQETAARAAVRALGGQSRWLLVFDNVADERDLIDLIPPGAGRVLVTSRDPGLARLGAVVSIEPFPEKVATRFLLDRTGSTEADAAATLADEVGGLPLALEQAAAYCVSSGIGLAGYLERYRSDRGRLMRQGAPAGRLAVQATLTLAAREAGRRDPAAAQLLRLCAFFAGPTGIPRWLVTADLKGLPAPLRRAAGDLIRFDAAVAVLVRLALVKADGDLLRVHPLVQDLLVDQIGRARPVFRRWRAIAGRRLGGDRTAGWDVTRWVRLAAELAATALPDDPSDPSGWERWASVTPHASRLLEHVDGSKMLSATTARLRNQIGLYLEHRGEYADARLMLDQAYQEFKRVLGDEHPDTLASMNNLALVLHAQGDLDAAHHLHQQALDARRQVLGDEHPDTLASMNNLALVLHAQGDLDAAHHLHQQALDARRRVLGDEHPNTLNSMNNLAEVLHAQGDLDAAHHLHQQALEVSRMVLGNEHPNTLTSMNNLAEVLHAQGDLDAAHHLHQEVLDVRRRVLGDEHPDTLTSMNNLALVLHGQGHLTAARDLHQQELDVRRRVLGDEHPNTLTSMNNLALVLHAQGDLTSVHHIHQQVLDMCRRILGNEHPNTLKSMNNLAEVLAALGRHEEADRLRAEARRGDAAVPDVHLSDDRGEGRADDGAIAPA